jgi:predicted dehydrogenase
MTRLTRREFLRSSALGAAALSMSASSYAQVRGANDSVRLGVIGVRGRGGDHIKGFAPLSGVRIAALCDCDATALKAAVELSKKLGHDSKSYADLRQLLDDKEIDAISTATPNHWHALVTVWGCQAGKDVYCEKPVSHNVWEGRQAVAAARKYDRIVQTGTQTRSSRAGVAAAVAWVQQGNLGPLQLVRGICYKRRASIGKVDGPQPIPPGVDYDLWCGPAPKEPLLRKNLHYDWHWVWNTGNGDIGNQGIHQMDIARWLLGATKLSPRVWSVGGRFGYVDDGQTANTQIVFHDYAPAPLMFEVRGLPEKQDSPNMDQYQGQYMGCPVGVVAHCEGGQVFVPGYAAEGAAAYDKDGKLIQKWSGTEDHFANFIKAVRSRKREDLHAEILEGHLSSALCHTGNISYRLGEQSTPDEIREQIKADRDALSTFERMVEHLRVNDVRLDGSPATLGAMLKMDPDAERFIGHEQANELLSREYRVPFVVPAEV